MLTKIKLKSMATTHIETVVDDIVMERNLDSKITSQELVNKDVVVSLFEQEKFDDVVDSLHLLNWGDNPVGGKWYSQYLSIDTEDDIEIVLRLNSFGNKTVVVIKTATDDPNYDDAVVHVVYSGSGIGLYEELQYLNITRSNIESQNGDLLLSDIQLKPEYEYKPGVDLEQTGKVTYLHRFDKLPPDEYKLTSIETGETVTVTMNPDDPKSLTAQNGDLIDIDLD